MPISVVTSRTIKPTLHRCVSLEIERLHRHSLQTAYISRSRNWEIFLDFSQFASGAVLVQALDSASVAKVVGGKAFTEHQVSLGHQAVRAAYEKAPKAIGPSRRMCSRFVGGSISSFASRTMPCPSVRGRLGRRLKVRGRRSS